MKNERKYALTAGWALILMALLAAFTYGYAHSNLVDLENVESTVYTLKSSEWLFISEILGWHFILLCDVVVAWAFYNFFKNEKQKLSALSAGLRFIYAAILGVAILNLIYVLKIVKGNLDISPAGANQQILFYLKSFERTWSVGLIIFGFHLLILGILVFKSKQIPQFWGVILVFAAVSYSIIHSSLLLLPEYKLQIKNIEMLLSFPMAFAEIGFAFWLLVRGGKPKVVYSFTKVNTDS